MSLTAVDRKMQILSASLKFLERKRPILSASFEVLLQHVLNCCGQEHTQILSASFELLFQLVLNWMLGCRVFLSALKFCFQWSLTTVKRKMQILSANFEVLFQQVFNFSIQEDTDFICQLSSFLGIASFCFFNIVLATKISKQVTSCNFNERSFVKYVSGPPVYDVIQGNPISTLPPCAVSNFQFQSNTCY